MNEGTQDRRTVKSDGSGLYQILNLQPATYRLEAEAAGFKRFVRPEIVIGVNQTAQIDVHMEVGAVTESVEVTAATPLLEPQTSSLGQVVDERKVRDLPLNGRNPLALVALTPAVIPQSGSQGSPAGQNPLSPGNFQIGGGTANQSQAYLDGAPLNLTYVNIIALVPTQDAVSEFKVQTNSLSAEFGRTAGGVINMATRAGSNKFHGTTYEFLRNRELNSNTFFNNRAGVGRPPFVQNQYGVEAEGPIIKDKLFIMGNWEGYRQRVGKSLVLSVPTAAMRIGRFLESARREWRAHPHLRPRQRLRDPRQLGLRQGCRRQRRCRAAALSRLTRFQLAASIRRQWPTRNPGGFPIRPARSSRT